MRCGCVIFDENRPEAGWASIEGGDAFRIKGMGDLRSDILWWTSLPYEDFCRSGLSRVANMRFSDYMRSPMKTIMDEIGITTRFIPVNAAVSVLSEIFSRVMTICHDHYGLKSSVEMRLYDDLRRILIGHDYSLSEEMDQAAYLAYQPFVKCFKNPSRVRTRSVMFRRNRYLHGMDILNNPIPGDQFEYIKADQMPKPSERLNWILRENRPALINGAVVSVAQDVANVIAVNSGSKNKRAWISHPELVAMSPYAKFEINAVFLFKEYKPLELKIDAPAVKPGFGMLSYSIGLVTENLWVGIASPAVNKSDISKKIYTPRAAWMRAYDRCYTMLPAMMVHKEGIQVSSYSLGSVSIDVPYGNLQEVIEVAGEAGLYPPLSVPDDAQIQGDLS